MKITAAITHGIDSKFSLEEVELAAPGTNEVLIKVHSCGVCHTDEAARLGHLPVPMPIVLGHEASGVIEALGPGVEGFDIGDHVGVSYASCGHCENCLEGHPYACENFNAINFGGVTNNGVTVLSKDGTPLHSFFGQSGFATYALVNTRSIFKADKDIDLGLLGPLGCGIQTGAGAVLNRLKPKAASSIAIFGCGSVGLSALMAAKIAGCTTIIAVNRSERPLEIAKELGATHTICLKEVADPAAEIKKITNGGVHYSIDSTGRGEIVRMALNSTKFLGQTVVVGATGDITFNVQAELMGDAKSLIGVVEGDSVPQVFIPALIRYYKAGMFPFDKLITYYPFEEIQKAFDESSKTIKSILVM